MSLRSSQRLSKKSKLFEESQPKKKSEANVFVVEEIVDHEIRNRGHFYLVKWENYPIEDCTWEPESNLSDCFDKIEEFFNKNTNKQQSFIRKEQIKTKESRKKSKTSDDEENQKNETYTPEKKSQDHTKHQKNQKSIKKMEHSSTGKGQLLIQIQSSEGQNKMILMDNVEPNTQKQLVRFLERQSQCQSEKK